MLGKTFAQGYLVFGRAFAVALPKLGRKLVTGRRLRRLLPPRSLAGRDLMGIPLTTLPHPTPLSITDLRMVYEEHLDRYVVNGPRSPRSELDLLRQALRIPNQKLEDWLLPANLLEWEGGALVMLTALISNMLDIPLQGAVLETDRFKIGVADDGKVFSRFHPDFYVKPYDYTNLLYKPTFGRGRTSPVFTSLYYEICSLKNESLTEAFLLLQLYVNEAEFCCLFEYRKLGTVEEQRRYKPRALTLKTLKKTESLIRISHRLKNPVPKFWRTLVHGGVMPPREFLRIFAEDSVYAFRGRTKPIPESRRQLWLSTITTIIARNQDD